MIPGDNYFFTQHDVAITEMEYLLSPGSFNLTARMLLICSLNETKGPDSPFITARLFYVYNGPWMERR